ncbi:MAG: hypothetical protein ACREQ5_05250 [Candidatus Dormibacteria bacterium]
MAGLNVMWNLGLAYNYRVIAVGDYWWTCISDFLLAILFFLVFKQLQAARGPAEILGYAAGGAVGAVAGVWLSKVVLHQ